MKNQKLNRECDKNSNLIMEFLALFNKIDKHFDKLLWIDKLKEK